jgi:predicted ATPase/DNA-binding XRE family transcriptional regulator
MEQHSFGHWLRLKRKALDLTREQLAEQVGYSAATIRKIEDEERHPSEQVVERLADIFNIPQNERRVFLRFARGDWKSAPAQSVEETPWRASTKSKPLNLPATTTSLIGREKEIAHLHNDLLKADIRLITLLGPPGIGKTRLSIETARALLSDFPDGVFFVALAPLNDPSLIALAVAQSLGFVGARNISTIQQLKEGIGDKHLLLVMDNCEHLIEVVASLAAELLSTCPCLKILATSRESLRIPGEWLYPVPAFDIPVESSSLDMDNASTYPALTLFAERARAVRSDFALNEDNLETVAAICARLDGLPLVIELIAARMRLMSPQALLDRLSSQFVLTADGMRAASERQKTLHNAIDWSYNLLPPEEQRLFACLSVFSGSFTLESVEAMFSQKIPEKPLPTLLALLLDKSLLKLAPNLEESAEARYTMLVTIQEYARERLGEIGEETEIRNLHLAYFLNLAEKADEELRGHNQLKWFSRLNSDRDNLRAALDWAIKTKQTEIALQIARKSDWFWFMRSDHNEGRQWLQRVLEMPETPLYPDAQAEVLTQLAHHLFIQVGENQQRPFIEQALSIAHAHNDKHNKARALAMLGLNMTDEKNYAAAQSALEESRALYQEVHDEWGYAHAVMCLAYSLSDQHNLTTALSLQEQALVLFRKLGDRFFENVTLRGIAIIQIEQNDVPRAAVALREAVILAKELDSKLEIAGTLSRWGDIAQLAGRPAHAVCLYWAAKNLFDLVGAAPYRYGFDLDKKLAPCRAALSEAEFANAEEQGRTMTMEQAIAYALESSYE